MHKQVEKVPVNLFLPEFPPGESPQVKLRKIFVADDLSITQEAIRMNFTLMKITDRVNFFGDGPQLLTAVRSELTKLSPEALSAPDGGPSQPITVMMLDFLMPGKNGLEVLAEVREMYQKVNEKMKRQAKSNNIEVSDTPVKMPIVVILTSFSEQSFKDLCAEEHKIDYFCAKPLHHNRLKEILDEQKIIF